MNFKPRTPYNIPYEKPKEQLIRISEVAKHAGWIGDWDSFLWYIADHAYIKTAKDYYCVLEITSPAHEFHVSGAIEEYPNHSLAQSIQEDMEAGIIHKFSNAYRNQELITRLLLSELENNKHLWESIFTHISFDVLTSATNFDWAKKTFIDTLAVPSLVERKYPDDLDLSQTPDTDNIVRNQINQLHNTGEYNIYPLLEKGRVVYSDNTIILFKTRKTDVGTFVDLTKFIKTGESFLWCASCQLELTEAKDDYIPKYLDNYSYRLNCRANSRPVPNPDIYLTKIHDNTGYITEMLGKSNPLLCWVTDFCHLMAYINWQIMVHNQSAHEDGLLLNGPVTLRTSSKSLVKKLQEGKSWSVKGHCRTYKATGKQVYVRPHTRGNGKYKKKHYSISGKPVSDSDTPDKDRS